MRLRKEFHTKWIPEGAGGRDYLSPGPDGVGGDMNKYYVVSPIKCECGRGWSPRFLTDISSEIEEEEGLGNSHQVTCLNCGKKYSITWVCLYDRYYEIKLELQKDLAGMVNELDKRVNAIEYKLKWF